MEQHKKKHAKKHKNHSTKHKDHDNSKGHFQTAKEKVEKLQGRVKLWQITTVVLSVLLIVSVVVSMMGGGSEMSGQEVADSTVKFLNEEILQGQGTVTLTSVEESGDLYLLKLTINGESMDSYVTKDGKMLFPQAIPLGEAPQAPEPSGNQALDVDINTEDSASKGAKNAKVVMVEYSSFSCGYCNKVRATIDKILTNYPNDVKMVYKHFNRGGTDSKTGQAAECAGDQGKFWEMHDLIFDKGSQGDLVGYAQEIGIDVDTFSECLDTGKYAAKVTADTNEAKSFGIRGTPGFMINGRLVSGAQPYENFKQVIDEELGLKPKTATAQPPAAAQPTPAPSLPKTDKPVVELFVMSHCPYGTQMEKGALPVVKELGDKIDFELKFVNYDMHPTQGEVEEQLNQYCIQEEQNDKYLDYLSCFLEAGDGNSCLSKIGIDTTKLSACTAKVDEEYDVTKNLEDKASWLSGRFPKFMIHDAENQKYGVRGSPTLVINGQQAKSGRDAQSVLNAVCGAFSNPPAECNTDMTSFGNPAPGFGFGTQGGSATAAGCGA